MAILQAGGKVISHRKTAVIVGMLFITAMTASMPRYFLLDPVLDAQDYLTEVAANEGRVMIGALSFLILAVALAGIAVVMYPILRKHKEALALGYVGVRIVEGVLFVIAAITILTIFALSQEYVKAGSPDSSHFQTIGDMLLAVRYYAYTVIWPVTLSLGALMFYYLLYQSKLIPRWLSVWGFVAAPLFPAGPLSLFGSTISGIFVLPLVVNEMVLATWLIVKGFNPSAVVFESARESEGPN